MYIWMNAGENMWEAAGTVSASLMNGISTEGIWVPIMQVLTFSYSVSAQSSTQYKKLTPQNECCLLKNVAWVDNIEKGKAQKN